MLTVGITHLLCNIRLHGTLVGAHLEDLHLDAQFLHQSGEEHGIAAQTAPVQHAYGVQIYLVGHGAKVVGRARVGVGIGNDPFAALLEFEQSLT